MSATYGWLVNEPDVTETEVTDEIRLFPRPRFQEIKRGIFEHMALWLTLLGVIDTVVSVIILLEMALHMQNGAMAGAVEIFAFALMLWKMWMWLQIWHKTCW